MNDSNIVKLLFERKDSAITELEAKYGSVLKNYASKCLSDKRDAEEVYVDALTDTWNSIPPERPRDLGAYVMAVLKRRVCDRIRYATRACRNRDRETFLAFEDGDAYGVSDSAESVVVNGKKGVLEDFLLNETKNNRVIFVKRYYFGKSVKEIANEVGMTENTVSARLKRTKERLLRYLTERGVIA